MSNQQHPPEPRGPRRRRTHATHHSTQAGPSSQSFLRRWNTINPDAPPTKVTKGAVQESFSCYEGLSWETLRGYLESKWPGWNFTQTKVQPELVVRSENAGNRLHMRQADSSANRERISGCLRPQAVSQRCVIYHKIAFEVKNCTLKSNFSLGRPFQYCRAERPQQSGTQSIGFRLGIGVPTHGRVYVLTTNGCSLLGGVAFGRMAQSLVRLRVV